MAQYSHQFLVAVTVESDEPDPDKLTELELCRALQLRWLAAVDHEGRGAFSHNDTDEV